MIITYKIQAHNQFYNPIVTQRGKVAITIVTKQGARGENEKAKDKYKMETNSRKETGRGRVELMGENGDDRKVEDLCKGCMCDEAQGG